MIARAPFCSPEPTLLLGIALLIALPALSVADAVAGGEAFEKLPAAKRADLARSKAEEDLTGEDIYSLVLENRFETFTQRTSLISGDRAGNEQKTTVRLTFQDFRDEFDRPRDGVTLSKSIVYYEHPFDLRHSGYLVINNLDRPNDQFVYRSSTRKVLRVNLRGEPVFGTDFSFEDILPRELDDASYVRKPDTELEGVPVFVIEATPSKEADSEYSRFIVYVEKARCVPLLTRYWDDREVRIKELDVEREAIEEVAGVWVPRRSTMRHLKLGSFTRLVVEEIQPNPKLTRTTFELRRLEGH